MQRQAVEHSLNCLDALATASTAFEDYQKIMEQMCYLKLVDGLDRYDWAGIKVRVRINSLTGATLARRASCHNTFLQKTC